MSHLWSVIVEFLRANSFASGGLVLGTLGGLAVWARRLPAAAGHWVWRRVVLEARIDESERAFHWLDSWFHAHPYARRARRLRLVMHGSQLAQVPGEGQHLVTYRDSWLWLSHSREKFEASQLRNYNRSYTLRVPRWRRALLEQLFDEARAQYQTTRKDSIDFYINHGAEWRHAGEHPLRRADTVIYPAGVLESVMADARWFHQSESWYNSLGIPYRRGYLLTGSPGTGKSTLALVLASELDYNLYTLDLADPALNDARLGALMISLEERSLVLVEDVDALFSGRVSSANNHLTFSGVINALDGLLAGRSRLLVLTTNHPERLDPALCRPGRVDRTFTFGPASPDQALRLWQRFHPTRADLAPGFADWAGNGLFSMADLQQHLINHLESPEQGATADGITHYTPNSVARQLDFEAGEPAAAAIPA